MDESLTSIDWKAVAIVGELTTPSGPYFDDHFLVLVNDSRMIAEIPSQFADESVRHLEDAIGLKMAWGLCHRTDAASRIVFPAALAERPLFEFSEPPHGWDILKKLFRPEAWKLRKRLTKEVEDYLASHPSR